jgi:hypothetical protein
VKPHTKPSSPISIVHIIGNRSLRWITARTVVRVGWSTSKYSRASTSRRAGKRSDLAYQRNPARWYNKTLAIIIMTKRLLQRQNRNEYELLASAWRRIFAMDCGNPEEVRRIIRQHLLISGES